MLEDFNRDYEELKRRVSALESRPLELDIYKDLPPVLTADDLIDFLHIGTTKAYEILDLIGFKVARSKRCTKTKLLEWIEGGGTP